MSHRSTDPGGIHAGDASSSGRDFDLGIPGFRYSDLHDARRLADLAREFDLVLMTADPGLFARFDAYRRQPASLGPVEQSNLLIDVARQVSRFVGRLFDIEPLLERTGEATRAQDAIFVFKRDFLQRRALKKHKPGEGPKEGFAALDARVGKLRRAPFPQIDFDSDPQVATARMVVELMGLQSQLAEVVRLKRPPEVPASTARRVGELKARLQAAPGIVAGGAGCGPEDDLALIERILSLLEDWCAARLHDPAGRAGVRSWTSYRFPEDLDYQRLVLLERPDPVIPEVLKGPDDRMRRRDGFKLTDPRMTAREILGETHYCVLCHDRDKDSCSKGFREKAGGYRKNPLGIQLQGCPLDETISEAHALKRQGDALAALVVICVDNPMCPGTGHRICNDCMKGCIYQKQEPVNIPQIETGILTDVLGLPYGFEIWSLLTRWNPLKIARPYPLPFNGRNVLVVGLGPAGYTLALHLVNEGFGVVGIDGLKIEPLPADRTGADGLPPRPVRDVQEITGALDERMLSGFGGVSEYGITVRRDKNFLTMIHLDLAERKKARFYGGVRFGGTITVEQAWEMGFDHVAIAAGAGRPTIIDMKNNLIRGIRKASDFLMALQLTGAFKRIALANLEARLPAIVVGGGLTAIDSATELAAYYPVQVEKILERFTELQRSLGETRVWAPYSQEERERLVTFLEHGRAVRAERERARRAGELPDFASLVNAWGGVSIVYRKSLVDSPAYRLNHEEIQKALEEGIRFVECMDPDEAVPDESGWLKEVVFKRMRRESGLFVDTGERVRFPARTLLVAAGTSPNVTYEKEHPGSFALDERRQFFRAHRAERGPDGTIRLVPVQGKDEVGFFTSATDGGRVVAFFGGNHPQYAGNVVRAMASARDGFMQIVELFASDLARLDPRDQPVRDARLRALFERLEDNPL